MTAVAAPPDGFIERAVLVRHLRAVANLAKDSAAHAQGTDREREHLRAQVYESIAARLEAGEWPW